jgi:hypothetical protein
MVFGNDDFNGPLDGKIHSSTTDGIKAGLDLVKKWMDHPAMNKRLVILNGGEKGTPGRHDFMGDGHNVTILGCTLWSKHRGDQVPNEIEKLDIELMGNSSKKNNARHEKDLNWLRHAIAEIRIREADPDRVIIVMTHHAPCITRTVSPDLNEFFGLFWSDFQVDILGGEGMRGLGKGDVWVFGHTHWSADFQQDDVRIFANQRGREGEKSREEFDGKRVLEVECGVPKEWRNWSVPY